MSREWNFLNFVGSSKEGDPQHIHVHIRSMWTSNKKMVDLWTAWMIDSTWQIVCGLDSTG